MHIIIWEYNITVWGAILLPNEHFLIFIFLVHIDAYICVLFTWVKLWTQDFYSFYIEVSSTTGEAVGLLKVPLVSLFIALFHNISL